MFRNSTESELNMANAEDGKLAHKTSGTIEDVLTETKMCEKCGERPAHDRSRFCDVCRKQNRRNWQENKRRKEAGLNPRFPFAFEALVEWCKTERIREIVGRVAK